MSSLRSIDIDIDVHKRIEMERLAFDETPNDILRRLLEIKEGDKPGNGQATAIGPGGRPWSGKGVTLPHGTSVRMKYNGKGHNGQIDNGEWLVEGSRFSSPSAAAGGVARTRSGKSPSLDGWIYWQVKRPGDPRWLSLSALREQHTRA
jgi:hypothetical protein